MEEDWNALGTSVPYALLRVATSEEGLDSLDGALAELDVRVEMARRLALGPMARADDIRVAGDPQAAMVLLQAALAEIARARSTHAGAGLLFALYRRHVAWNDRALVGIYKDHRAEAILCAKRSVHLLLAAVSSTQSAVDVYAVAQSVPYESPLWDGCTSAAEHLARRAHEEASAARQALVGMYHAVSLQFFDSWKILKAAERERWARLARAVPAKILRWPSSSRPSRPTQHRERRCRAPTKSSPTSWFTTMRAATSSCRRCTSACPTTTCS